MASYLPVTVTLADDGRFRERLLDALARKLSDAFARAAGGAAARVGAIAAAAIQASPEYASLLTGELRGQLGAVDAAAVLRRVCENVAGGVRVTSLGVRRQGDGLSGGVRVALVKGDYSEVLGAEGATFTSEGGFEIPWLRWLTLEGDAVLVADHHFEAGHRGRSRTGLGLMVKPGSWRVPPQFAGTAEDNWVLRALSGVGPAVAEALVDEIRKAA